MSRRLLGVAIAATALLAAACVPLGPALPAPPPGVGVPANSPALTIDGGYITGLSQPWDIAFAPDGTLLYTEKGGYLSSFSAGTKTVLGAVTSSTTFGEGGLMGIALHPDFATNNFAYVCTTTTAADNQIIRLTLDLTAPAGSGIITQVPVITGMTRDGVHNGCRVRFQPGSSPSALFWSMGDAANGSLPQNLDSGNGKIFRAAVDAAGVLSPHPGNTHAYVFTYGHRNPQGLAFNPTRGYSPYNAEHGPGINDEVNALYPGGNAGWDPVPGYNQSVPMTDLGKFPGAMVPVWRSGDQRTIAPSGMTFIENFAGTDWKAWNGAIVIAVLKDSELRVLLMNAGGTVDGQFQVPGSTGTRLRSVVQSPTDGLLYVATDVGGGGGAIWQITPS